ncbi:gfo/Idh/MocA family oxidoreductase [Auraticoccus sp. F435]|uniref:Gfo/Idh/MocA family oxidoreductase n=1 Tax=Auraticoccus cholistanensis TaxID=2656650 RepID=A0A6A9V0V2_9ACTN|nr:Gfo/Idh/MocA family oxidoreductase [Auraticoccus cholistanensis]MVA76299.1 gfo/Idh/MocA family oxidoreductase [Auraticoccus cholistanensis]
MPVVVVGAGAMGRAWLQTVQAGEDAELVGVADLDLAAARDAVAALGRPDLPVDVDVLALAARTGARAVVDVTVPAAHHPVTTAALFAGLAVLGEKPAAATLAQALSLTAAAEVTGQLFAVSQSRRHNPRLARFRELVRGLGAVGSLSADFFRAPRFGGFREEMAQPLLVDMAIHHFDAARYLLDVEPVAVYCESWNPPWSWYAGDASASAVFELADGSRFVFDGSWCAPGEETSWNGHWRVSAEHGTAEWDGEGEPRSSAAPAQDAAPDAGAVGEGIAGALTGFCAALRTGAPAPGEVHENVLSLAMVEAAVESATTGGRVLLDDVLERARRRAVAEEIRDDVRDVLTGWPSVREALARGRDGASPPRHEILPTSDPDPRSPA